MVEKIRAAREAARQEGHPDLIINGRTDALSVAADRNAGLNESIARANLYLDAGADLAFVTGVATIAEVKTLVQGIHGPVSIAAGLPNNINTMSIADLRACGVRRVSLPVIAIFSAIQALTRTLAALRDSQDFSAIQQEQAPLLGRRRIEAVDEMSPAPCGHLILLRRIGSRGNEDWLRRLDHRYPKITAFGDGACPLFRDGRHRFRRKKGDRHRGGNVSPAAKPTCATEPVPLFPPTLRRSTNAGANR